MCPVVLVACRLLPVAFFHSVPLGLPLADQYLSPVAGFLLLVAYRHGCPLLGTFGLLADGILCCPIANDSGR